MAKSKATTLGLAGSIVCCIIALIVAWYPSASQLLVWSIAQWMPIRFSIVQSINEATWKHFEASAIRTSGHHEEVPMVYVQAHLEGDLLPFIVSTYGKDWRKRPLLLKGLWSPESLKNSSRRLTPEGLLKENLTIPYFTDARLKGALSPDSSAPVKDIIANITTRGAPHKIGTQFMVQTYPELIYEVAPVEIVTELFGAYFNPTAVKGMGPFQLFPALTTVPVFVASGKAVRSTTTTPVVDTDADDARTTSAAAAETKRPYTALHCEPIGNVAVQLSGKKQWTLVRPEFSHLVKPSLSPDGRAFFASWATANVVLEGVVPSYTAITAAGDAMWVPTWTWHRVDYIESEEMAIGGSLFHFRAFDFVRNNPLFAILVIPAILMELVGYNTQ